MTGEAPTGQEWLADTRNRLGWRYMRLVALMAELPAVLRQLDKARDPDDDDAVAAAGQLRRHLQLVRTQVARMAEYADAIDAPEVVTCNACGAQLDLAENSVGFQHVYGYERGRPVFEDADHPADPVFSPPVRPAWDDDDLPQLVQAPPTPRA